jgi:hypothetical protein
MAFVSLFTRDSIGVDKSLRSGHHSTTRESHAVIRIAQTFLINAQILTLTVDFCREHVMMRVAMLTVSRDTTAACSWLHLISSVQISVT